VATFASDRRYSRFNSRKVYCSSVEQLPLATPTEAVDSFWSYIVADTFDPYREALVMEAVTIWPDEYDGLELSRKSKIEAQLHAAPDKCTELEYVRVHTGFCRQITVTPEDLARIGG
jgi:hypothetical protein